VISIITRCKKLFAWNDPKVWRAMLLSTIYSNTRILFYTRVITFQHMYA